MRICLYTNTALPKLGGQEIVIDALARQFLALGHEPVVLAPWREIAGPVRRGFRALSGRLASAVPLHALVRFAVWPLDGQVAPDLRIRRDPLPRDLPGRLRRRVLQGRPRDCRWSSPAMATTWRRGDFTIASRNSASDIAWPWSGPMPPWPSAITRPGCFAKPVPSCARIVLIPNGVEVEQFAAPVPRPANLAASIRSKSYLLFLGRLDPRKGIDVLAAGDGPAARPMRSRPGRGRTRTGRPGPGSPGRAARSCPAGPFRRPNRGPAEAMAAAKQPLHDRSFAKLGGLWRRGRGEPCRRPAGHCLAVARPGRPDQARPRPGCWCRPSRRKSWPRRSGRRFSIRNGPTTGAVRRGSSSRPLIGGTLPCGISTCSQN